jgi:hypothetical protein
MTSRSPQDELDRKSFPSLPSPSLPFGAKLDKSSCSLSDSSQQFRETLKPHHEIKITEPKLSTSLPTSFYLPSPTWFLPHLSEDLVASQLTKPKGSGSHKTVFAVELSGNQYAYVTTKFPNHRHHLLNEVRSRLYFLFALLFSLSFLFVDTNFVSAESPSHCFARSCRDFVSPATFFLS